MIVKSGEFDFAEVMRHVGLVKRPQGRRKRSQAEHEFFNIVTAFDIETTTIDLPIVDDSAYNTHSFMYIWMWQIGPNYTVIGRTWDEFLNVCGQISAYVSEYKTAHGLALNPHVICYIHNAAYEWQFLAGIYPFADNEVFFNKPRKPLYFRMFDALEFRCSYKLSNMSLDKFARAMGAKTQKQSGQKFDYSKTRFADTPLSDDELLYCVNDVIALEESIRLRMARDDDDLKTIPYTSTGYVRRDCKMAVSPIRRFVISPMLPTKAQYRMLRAAFRGGNTHAAALTGMVGRVLHGVESYDMASCYPAQQLTQKFPMKPFEMLKRGKPVDLKEIFWWISRGYAVVGEYVFTGLRLKNPREPIPYISLAKTVSNVYEWKLTEDGRVVDIESDEPGTAREMGVECDNGRIIRAGLSAMTITEIDLQIILETYTFDALACRKAMVAYKDYLPAEYRAVIQRYFDRKTALKAARDEESVYMYNKSKNMLNSVYGMSATDPVHSIITLDLNNADNYGGEFTTSDYDTEGIEDALAKAPFPYQWGVYTTAYARAALQDGIRLAGEQMVYCDTDSIKTLGHIDFTELNAQRRAAAEEFNACCADTAGVMHYVGVFEYEGAYNGGFITQGAKRYAYRMESGTDPGGLHVTVSGVTHKRHEYYNDRGELTRAVEWCNEELGALENFKPGMLWIEAGGTASVYNDTDDFIYNAPDGHSVHITRNVAIVNTTYKLTYSKDYAELLRNLSDVELYAEWRKKHE